MFELKKKAFQFYFLLFCCLYVWIKKMAWAKRPSSQWGLRAIGALLGNCWSEINVGFFQSCKADGLVKKKSGNDCQKMQSLALVEGNKQNCQSSFSVCESSLGNIEENIYREHI